uniref:Protein LAZ1 homolog 2 n=1 Tax=Salix viminalis TaxID=40686 RepID=A0A6N2M981_SALVM
MATGYEDAYRDLHQPAVVIGGCFAVAAVLLSIFLIFQHLKSYTNPAEQKWIVAVIFMVPVYATQSILSLWNPRMSVACDILRNCYEAFAFYSFGSYLVACLGGERSVIELLENESQRQLGITLLEWKNEKNQALQRRDLFTIERFGLVQYMILKTLCAFLAFLLELFGVFGDGEFKWYYGYPYIMYFQTWALYCLVQFYNVTHEQLKPIKPLPKFISFKAIVFATWWQGLVIALLCAFGFLPNVKKFRTGLQDFLICVEMAIAAVAHIYVFSAEPYSCFIPVSGHGRVSTDTTTKAEMKFEEGGQERSAVVKDVVLTLNQAIGPVEKGVTKIQEKIHRRFVGSKGKGASELEAEECVEENLSGERGRVEL